MQLDSNSINWRLTQGIKGTCSIKAMQNNSPLNGNLPVKDKTLEKMKKFNENAQDKHHNGHKAYKLLPNVRSFKVLISNYDKIFAAFGLQKRLKPKMKFEYHTNGSMNRYVKHQFKRMSECAITNPLKC